MSDIKYTEDGQEVVVVREVEGGYLVNHVYAYSDFSEDEGVEVSDQIVFYEKVYDKAPTFKLAQEIIDLEKQKEAIEEKICELKEMAHETRKVAQDVEKYPILRIIRDYLSQDYTHIVYMKNLEVYTKNQFSWSNRITVTNIGLDELHIIKHGSQYRSDYDPAIMVFKSEEDANKWIKKAAIKQIKSQLAYQYNTSDALTRMWNDIHYQSPAKSDKEVLEGYQKALDDTKKKEQESIRTKAQEELKAAQDKLAKLIQS